MLRRRIGSVSDSMNKTSYRPVRAAPAAARPVDADAALAQGRALHAQGRLSEAFSLYQAALSAQPENPEALHLLGVAYLGLRQPALGIAFVRRAIARRPDAPDYRMNLATALLQLGQAPEALAEMQLACELRPDDAQGLAMLGGLCVQLQRFDEAERRYAAAVALQPDQAEWHEALARLRYLRWAMPEAVPHAQRAVGLAPRIAERLNMGFARAASPAPHASPARLLNAAAEVDAAALERACIERDLLVIDDFLPDPVAFRAEALRLCATLAQRSQNGNFPGVQTPPQPVDATMQRIADLLGRAVKWDSPDNGALRVSLAADEARADVHVDNPTLPHIFGGVLYLSRPEDCRGGTRFYRHRATGWDRRPDDAALAGMGHASFLDFQKRHLPINRRLPFAEWQQQRDATWEFLFEVPMRFNRLIVFRSDFFHAITELFGDSPESGRLVQLFHFESER
jgi:Flp pilus assembly protein TadD